MRFAFLDEGGISRHEPNAVVGGVFVNADEQVVPLEDELDNIVHKHIPEQDWRGFVLHAKDIWSAKKYFKDRDTWPWERRAAILADLADIPSKLNIPVVFGWLAKEELRQKSRRYRDALPRDFEIACHAIAASSCILRVEQMMRLVWPKEIAQVVAEDNHEVRRTIKEVLKRFKFPEHYPDADFGNADILPLQRIRGSIQFADKTESRCLQLADACAFFIRRRFFKHDWRSTQFYDKLKPMMLVLPFEDQAPEPSEPRSIRSSWPFGPLELLDK